MKTFSGLCLFFLLLFLYNTKTIFAKYDPLQQPNNKFGIHIIDENDLLPASSLINSTGGDWGYVTIVIQEDDRNLQKWQSTFDKMRRLHLIPLVRLATRIENGVWIKPRTEDIEPWITFLNSLNWVIENRYIILFNEPNHAKEWGGQIQPQEYGQIASEFISKLNQSSSDFFVLPAGLDLAASDTISTMHPKKYLQKLYNFHPEIFESFDGWTSHSYPNPNFSGSPYAQGRNSVRGYQWEISTLKELGVTKNYPIFITETGWSHNQGKTPNRNLSSPDTVAQNFSHLFKNVYSSNQIIAVTPFILNYQDDPFSHFSWQKLKSSEFHPAYNVVQQLPKTKGQPLQKHDGIFSKQYFPDNVLIGSTYHVSQKVLNTGQSIWDENQISIKVTTDLPQGSLNTDPLPATQPFQESKFWTTFYSPDKPGDYLITFQLQKENQVFGQSVTYQVFVLPNNFLSHLKVLFEQLLHRGELVVSIFLRIYSQKPWFV